MGAVYKDNPFLRLQHAPGGTTIISKILGFALETVDVFVTNVPSDPVKRKHCYKVGPSDLWLQTHRYDGHHNNHRDNAGSNTEHMRKDGSDSCIANSRYVRFQDNIPIWSVVRIEVKLRLVCSLWKAIVEADCMVC